MAREYVGGIEVDPFPRDRDSLDRLVIAHEVRAYSTSCPPPPELVVVQERVQNRTRTDTDRFDIEELQRQLREAIERAAADKIAEARERALKAESEKAALEASIEKAVEKKSDRRWEIVVALLTVVAAAVIGHYYK